MREVARRAGVAAAAPLHHFGNAEGLLNAVAVVGFDTLASRQKTAVSLAKTPTSGLVALCQTYIEMGFEHSGYAVAMFHREKSTNYDPELERAAKEAFSVLITAVTKAAPKKADKDVIEEAAITLWATMHGFITLPLSQSNTQQSRVEFAVNSVLMAVAGSTHFGSELQS